MFGLCVFISRLGIYFLCVSGALMFATGASQFIPSFILTGLFFLFSGLAMNKYIKETHDKTAYFVMLNIGNNVNYQSLPGDGKRKLYSYIVIVLGILITTLMVLPLVLYLRTTDFMSISMGNVVGFLFGYGIFFLWLFSFMFYSKTVIKSLKKRK